MNRNDWNREMQNGADDQRALERKPAHIDPSPTVAPGTLDRLSTVEGLLRRAQGEIDSAIILDDDAKNAGDGQAAWVVVPLLQAVNLLVDEVREIKRQK